MLTTLIGRPIEELDTPALVIDLDAFDRNIGRICSAVKEGGASWRPHSKSHKCPAIAHKQIQVGAIGIACAKLGEAEVMGANGIRDILVPNQIVGPIKARRLAALAGQIDICVAVDNPANVRELDGAAAAHGTRPRVVIEINTGMNRAGVEPGDAARTLAAIVAGCQALRFAGLMTWEGHAWGLPLGDDRQAAIRAACTAMKETADAIRADGIPVEIVSAGGTATYLTSSTMPGITEIQAGGGVFGDIEYINQGADVEPAMSMRTIVTSRPTSTRVIVDAGRKSIDPSNCPPGLRGYQIEGPISFSAEHGIIKLAQPSEKPAVGDVIEFSIGYSDQCNHLHENFFGVRNGVLETIWPILGRGKLQ